MMETDSIYNLEFHQSTEVRSNLGVNFMVTRVPGGWIYEKYKTTSGDVSVVFVPYDNEFKEKQ